MRHIYKHRGGFKIWGGSNPGLNEGVIRNWENEKFLKSSNQVILGISKIKKKNWKIL